MSSLVCCVQMVTHLPRQHKESDEEDEERDRTHCLQVFQNTGSGKDKERVKNSSEREKVIFCSSRPSEEIDLFNSALGGFDGCGL